MTKQRNDSVRSLQKSRKRRFAQKEQEEISIINEFLPKQMSEEEIKNCLSKSY